MSPTRQYLIVDIKKHRRHSAPENLATWYTPQSSRSNLVKDEYWCRASVSDFSVLLENHSESASSLELDTSNLSRELSPVPTTKTSPRDSYQSLPSVDYLEGGKHNEDSICRSLGSWFIWKNVLLSQAMAGCLAIMVITNGTIKQNSENPITNGINLPHYILVGVLWTTKLALRNDGRDIKDIIKLSGFRYLFLSVLHVESNYLLCSSFQHGTYLGNQMVYCMAAFLSLVIGYVCMEIQFHFVHLSGFGLTIAGAIGLCMTNNIYTFENQEDCLLGDVLRITSGICLALNSIAQEIFVRSIDIVEYMGMIGLVGSGICGLQAVTLEGDKLLPRNSTYWSNILIYSVAQFFLNSLAPIVLRDMGATGLHLALMSSGFYSYAIATVSQKHKIQLLYLLSFALVSVGSALFTTKRLCIGTQYFIPVKVIDSKSGGSSAPRSK